jgi:hypothetical protein
MYSISIERIGHGLRGTPPGAVEMAHMLFGELIVNLESGKDALYEWATECAEEIDQARNGLETIITGEGCTD